MASNGMPAASRAALRYLEPDARMTRGKFCAISVKGLVRSSGLS